MTLLEVGMTLNNLINNAPPSVKLCFFIDGADEFQDPNTENYELAQLLSKWASKEWVKICLACREEQPWLEEFRNCPGFPMQKVNRGDIQLMIQSIAKHRHFRSFDPGEQEAFIDAFVDRAEGVFLWVRYLKPEIVVALDYKQNLKKLFEILNNAPTELGDFYKRMFDKIKEKEAWVILRILCTAAEKWKDPSCLVAHHYSFVKDILDDVDSHGPVVDLVREAKDVDDRLDCPTNGLISQMPRLFRGIWRRQEHIHPLSVRAPRLIDTSHSHTAQFTTTWCATSKGRWMMIGVGE